MKGDVCRIHLVVRGSVNFFPKKSSYSALCNVFGLSGFLANRFGVSSSEEEERLLGHSCGECHLVGRTCTAFCLLCKHGHDASVLKPIKTRTWCSVHIGDVPPECLLRPETLNGQLLQERPPTVIVGTTKITLPPQHSKRREISSRNLTVTSGETFHAGSTREKSNSRTKSSAHHGCAKNRPEKQVPDDFRAQGNVELLEPLDIDQFVHCVSCPEKNRPGSIWCTYCTRLMLEIHASAQDRVFSGMQPRSDALHAPHAL